MSPPELCFRAETEDGKIVNDPSEDSVHTLIKSLALPDNSFLTIEPPDGSPAWFAVISLLPDGAYEVEYRDPARGVHDLTPENDRSRIAREVTMWLTRTCRFHERRPGLRSVTAWRSPTRLYDLLGSYWSPVAAGLGFAAVWCEGVSIEETARRLRADLSSATPCTLRGIGHGFDGDARPGDRAGIILVGEAGTWTLAVQVQEMDVTSEPALSALSRSGGRALSMGWHVNGAHRITYAVDGLVVSSAPMEKIPAPLEQHMEGLSMPGVNWDEDDEDGDFSTEEMIDTALVLAGRVTGRELDKKWLDAIHTRYVIPEGTWP
ncbi:hypothetical protein AB0B56_25640 [Streptosporangium canum]|uniref:DUF6461 domain-containing protein n=1 Tax=Streptosporangium canum TaxID=324952 RepID=UPI00341A4CF2